MTYRNIQTKRVIFPDYERHKISISQNAQDLITKLLEKNKANRLGTVNDVQDILGHPFFESIDISQLMSKSIKPPYMPEINGYDFFPKCINEEIADNWDISI